MGYSPLQTRGTYLKFVLRSAQVFLAFGLAASAFGEAALPAGAETLPELEDFHVDSDVPSAAPHVFNGEPVTNPGWIASILWDGDFICTASLIHPEWVLTAAHCVDEADSTYTVNVGSGQWYAGTNRQISEIFIHPGYNPAIIETVDLAMLKLSAPVASSSLPKLSATSTWPALNQSLVVVGWGQTFTGSPPADTLQAGGVWVESSSSGAVNAWCYEPWVAASGYEDFCFGGISWACPGDSGGPLVGFSSPSATSGAVDTIYGVTSFGQDVGCGDIWIDSVAQRVSPHVGWIKGFLPPPGDAADEVLFYRSGDGVFKYYDMKPNASLGFLFSSGTYSLGWDSITAVDLDGDGNDEQFFYRSTDGVFKYYDVKPNGSLGALLQSGVYSKGWDSVTAVDLDGDGKDEFFFYRSTDGVFKYYKTKTNGALGALLASGVYSLGWDSITAVD
ncbi:MAG: trypsin-like serine protease, partial [Acidimicrobiia bacterium]